MSKRKLDAAELPTIEVPEWTLGMAKNGDKFLNTTENFRIILENDEHFKGLQFNLLSYSPEKMIFGAPERWTDSDDAEARRYIESVYHIHSVQKLDDALRITFKRNEYHPIRQHIEKIEWDGKSRIANFLHFATNCIDTEYTREVSRLIFAGGIHRLYHPGCKFDDMPVLVGTHQGEGKSTLVRWLAMQDEWFGEVNEIDGQKGIEALEGIWIAEFAEMLAAQRAKEAEATKAYLTRQRDRYRHPFDKRVTEHPRQCIFIGTTNKAQFLTDKTGNRRFYPVEVRQSGYDLFNRKAEIKEYIRQCWAEALALIDDEFMQPFANRELIPVIREQQEAAVEDDYRAGLIRAYLDEQDENGNYIHDEVCIIELWKNVLAKDSAFSKPTRKDSNDIVLILTGFGDYESTGKAMRSPEFGVQKFWKRIAKKKPVQTVETLSDIPF